MALINRLDQNEVVQQTAPSQNTGATETKNQTSKPIDMTADKSAEEAKKNNEILDYLNSDEFKKLSEEEQLKAFKEKYGLGLSDEELTKVLTNAKKVAAEFAQRTVIESGADLQTTNAASSTDTIKAEIAAKKDIVEELKKQGIENPTQGDIYDYLVQLKESGAELTAEQAKILKTFNALLDNGFQGLKSSDKSAEHEQTQNTNQSLFTVDQVLSKDFIKKAPSEKLRIYMDAYLTKNDPEYAKLSDQKKKTYCKDRARELVQTLGKNSLSGLDNKTAFVAISILDDSQRKGQIINDFTDKSIAQKAQIATSNEIKKGINELLNRKEFANKTPEEQMLALADIIFAGDEKYANLPQEKKVAFIERHLQDKLDDMGMMVDIENVPVSEKRKTLTVITALLKDFAKQDEDVTLESYMKDMENPIEATNRLLAIVPETEENKELIEELKTTKNILKELKLNGIENPNMEQIHTYLNSKTPLSEAEQRIKKQLDIYKDLGADTKKFKMGDKYWNTASKLIYKGKSTEEIMNKGFRKFKNDPEGLSKYVTNILLIDGSKTRYFEVMAELEKHYSTEEINKLFPDLQVIAAGKGFYNDKGKDVADIAMRNPSNDKVSNIYNNSNKYLSEEENAKFIGTSIQNEILKHKAGKSLNNREIYSQEDAKTLFGVIDKLNIASDADLSSFTEIFMEGEAQNGTESQLYFAEELSQFGNAAITEGIAAASDSIDQNYRDAYNAIIEHSLSSGNYSNSESSRIMDALRTGNISQETLASTSIPDSAPVEENVQTSTPAQNATATASAAAASAAEQIQQAAQAAAQTISQIQVDTAAPAMPITNTVTSRISNTTGSVSGIGTSSATARTSASASTSSSKKAEALNNAADTKASIDSAVKKWEEEHNQTISNEAVEALKSSVSASVIEDVLNDPDAAGDSKSALRSLVSNASSINDLFTKLVSLYGSKVETRFVESLAANGSTAAIHSFAENNGSKEVIKDLYMKCGSSTLKSELLNLLPSTTVSEMLAAGEISDLGSVNYKVLKDYILKNLSNMSNSDFNNYLKYLPFDERQMLVKARLSQTSFTGSEGGDIGDYAEKLGYKPQSTQTSPVGGTQPQGASHPKTPSGVSQEEAVYDDGIEPFYDTSAEESLEEFTNESDNIQGLTPGSDEWVSQIRNRQAGIKVPPSSVYAEYSPEDRYFNWDIGAAGPTKLPFGRDYDKQKRGTVYWG